MHERASKTILCAQKSVHANVNLSSPDTGTLEKYRANLGKSSLETRV